MYQREVPRGIDVVHIFGRTQNPPYLPLLPPLQREAQPILAVGTPGRGVETLSSVPIVWNRRLHVFWPVFVEKPDKDLTYKSLPEGMEAAEQVPAFTLAWSEYRRGDGHRNRRSGRRSRGRRHTMHDSPGGRVLSAKARTDITSSPQTRQGRESTERCRGGHHARGGALGGSPDQTLRCPVRTC